MINAYTQYFIQIPDIVIITPHVHLIRIRISFEKVEDFVALDDTARFKPDADSTLIFMSCRKILNRYISYKFRYEISISFDLFAT